MKQTISIITLLGIGAFAGNMLNIGLTYALRANASPNLVISPS